MDKYLYKYILIQYIIKMTDITNLFENLTLNDNIDNLINEFSDMTIKCMNDEKEINELINSFDNLTIEKQQKCINIISNTYNSNIRTFLEKVGYILLNRHNRKCYIERIYSNNHFINC
jgi:Mg/Co/Ni transporter MgtE